MVVFDATYLMHLFRPEIGQPRDSAGQPIPKGQERLRLLVATLEKARTKIIVPSPALSEILVRAGVDASQRVVEAITKSSVMTIESFDALAAIEAATMTRDAFDRGNKKDGLSATWAKVKFDRQIVAIARVHQATAIYSDDSDVKTIAGKVNLQVIAIAELPVPPENPQKDMFEAPKAKPDEAEIAAAEIEAQIANAPPP
jgi:hypothetical protein